MGVAVVGEEMMLCESNNKGTIMIYDRELKYVRHIKIHNMGYFYAMSTDLHGNLYVTDYDNDLIQVFSNDGAFLRSIGCDGNGVKRLNGPYAVCVSGHYVYVTNVGHNVSVFTTAGDYVTSLGQYGDKEGDFDCPHDVCVDKDGFIYVADFLNNRIQCL